MGIYYKPWGRLVVQEKIRDYNFRRFAYVLGHMTEPRVPDFKSVLIIIGDLFGVYCEN